MLSSVILVLEYRGAMDIIMTLLPCALRSVCVPLKWSGRHHSSCTGRCSCYSYQVPLVRGRSLLFSEYKSRSEGLVIISARVGSLFLQSWSLTSLFFHIPCQVLPCIIFFVRWCRICKLPKCFQHVRHCVVRIQRGGIWR